MSGIEIVGLVASASQLVLYSIKITTCLSEIIKRAQDAPLRIRQHSDQIRQLLATAEYVGQHRHLQTVHVHAHIKATLEQAKTLSATLEQLAQDYSRGSIRRYWKILKGAKEKEILANFDRLEKEKSALLLCISVAQTDILGNIQGIQELIMAEYDGGFFLDCSEGEDSDGGTPSASYDAANEESNTLKALPRQGPNGGYVGNHQKQKGKVPSDDMAKKDHRGSSGARGTAVESYESPDKEMRNTYSKATSRQSDQAMCGDAPRQLFDDGKVGSQQRQMGQVPADDMMNEDDSRLSPAQGAAGKSCEALESGKHHAYDRAETRQFGRMMNGDASFGNSPSLAHLYHKPTAYDRSQMLNGNVDSVECVKAFFGPQHTGEVAIEYLYAERVVSAGKKAM